MSCVNGNFETEVVRQLPILFHFVQQEKSSIYRTRVLATHLQFE